MLQRIKPIILLLTTLLLGFFLGVLSSKWLFERRIESFRNQDRSRGFIQLHKDILGIEKQQEEVIDPVLRKYFDKLQESRMQVRNIMDSFHTELEPLLTPEQVGRLDSLKSRVRRRVRKGRGGPGGPPPFRPRP